MKHDDASRLVWADALLERGDPRGELITTQCALARGGLGREDSLRLRRREMELLAFVSGLPGLAEDWSWTRGAIEEITISGTDFLRRRDELFEKAPLLHRLRLRQLPEDPTLATSLVQAVLEDERIDGITLGTGGDPALVIELSEQLSRMRSLELRGLTLGMAMRSAALRNVEELSLVTLWDPFSARSHEPTAMRPRRVRLQSISQQKHSLALDSLAHHDFFARVEELTLEWFALRDVFVQASSPLLRRLRRLQLPTGRAATPLTIAANAEDLANLEELSISFVGNEDEIDFGRLTGETNFENLRVLRIGPGLTPKEKVWELLRSPLGQRLEVLDVRKNRWQLDSNVKDWDGILLT